ncbi:MAG: PKD domain-containing protein [Cytophagales bacterium]|nr:PKD domain-containing protein [Cytophagales bacterium]
MNGFCYLGSLITILLTLNISSSYATHIIGGELTYQCLGGDQYRFRLTVYSECGSLAVLESFYPIGYYAEELDISPESPLTFNVIKISQQEVPLLCDALVTDCSSGGARGIERVIYEGTVDLSNQPAAKDWRFFWQRAARSEQITTLLLPDAEDFFLDASLNNLDVACNNSPTFSNSAVITACIRSPQVFNNAATESDGDVLQYSLTVPKSAYDTEVVFESGYNEIDFLTFSSEPELDPNTGDLLFNADLLEIGITDFKVEEYRNGTRVGWVKRAIQMTTIDCDNNLPVLSNFNILDTDSISICAGDSISLDIFASDDDGVPLKMELQSGKPGVFQIFNNNTLNPEGRFRWRTDQGDIGNHSFVIRVSDNKCPDPGVTIKTYQLYVNAPQFDLGTGFPLDCNTRVTLDPAVSGGSGDFARRWSNNSTATSIDVGIGQHFLSVQDNVTGCTATDSITFLPEFSPGFKTDSSCFGLTTAFTDTTVSNITTKNIVSWLWDFGDGATSTLQNPKHTYAAPGFYEVTLTVEDDAPTSCSYSMSRRVRICEPPGFNFAILGQCTSPSLASVVISPRLPIFCDQFSEVIVDFGDGSELDTCIVRPAVTCDGVVGPCVPQPAITCNEIFHSYSIGNTTYTVTVTVKTESSCTATKTASKMFYQSPDIDIIPDDFYLVCSSPDSLIETQLLHPGNGTLIYGWQKNFLGSYATTPNALINTAGIYSVTVSDEKSCFDLDNITVTYPLEVLYDYEPYCEEDDPIAFLDRSVSATNTLTQWKWTFGDPASGSLDTVYIQNPSHKFSQEGDFGVTLEVIDSDGCFGRFHWPVYNTGVEETDFRVTPTSGELCLGEIVNGSGVTGRHIDSEIWDLGNGIFVPSKNIVYQYPSGGSYQVAYDVQYNFNERATDICSANFQRTIQVNSLPEVELVTDLDRFCRDEEVQYTFDTDDTIVSAQWEFLNTRRGTSETIDAFSTPYTFRERSNYQVELEVTDDKGCKTSRRLSQFADRLVIPDFEGETGVCPKTPMVISEVFRDTLENITNYRWDFGDGNSTEGQVPIPLIQHVYDQGGNYDVTLTIINSFSGCENSITKTVNVLMPPQAAFTYDTICAGNSATFVNISLPGDGEIVEYQWLFPDGSTASSENTSFFFEDPGFHPVSLVATSSLGCKDTVTHEVLVKEVPVAQIDLMNSFVEAFKPTQFFDASEGDIVSYYWNFGDGTVSNEKDPVHTYPAIDRYSLVHAVVNSVGCPDTVEILLDLDVYLELPTAFSPNNDELNDVLRLIHQGIYTLTDFKLYNRSGLVVFDGSGNPDSEWDGTYRGQLQPAGVYLAHVKATGAYGRQFNYKKNVTLLR